MLSWCILRCFRHTAGGLGGVSGGHPQVTEGIPDVLVGSLSLGGGHIIFAFSAVRRPTWFPDILGNSSYPIFTKFGMQVYWVNSLYGIAFGDDSSIAN